MRMNQQRFRIGELSRRIGIETFVIRFLEKEFKLACSRSQGGQRFYTRQDETRFTQIKSLLYEKGYTITGAKRYLQKQKASPFRSNIQANNYNQLPNTIKRKLAQLSAELRKIKELF